MVYFNSGGKDSTYFGLLSTTAMQHDDLAGEEERRCILDELYEVLKPLYC